MIFLVHGRAVGTRETVARFLEKAGNHGIVILDEQASRGRTLIEKLEQYAVHAQYAVVLLTGDDEGGPRGKLAEEAQPRARQNVVLELGWFCGLLGRERVIVLREPDVEQPSDIEGLVYISLEGEWQRRLAKELKHAGLDFSLDRL